MTREYDPNCAWTGFHLHQSANASASYPFCSNKFEDPSEGDNWQHKVHWLPDYTNDTDCDRWTHDKESYIGTDPYDDCTDQAGDADAWPPDINMDTRVNILDVLLFSPVMGTWVGHPAYDPRFDLNADGWINILDVLVFGWGIMGMRCTP